MDHLLHRALENKARLEMIYVDEQGRYSQRVIRVVKINTHDFLAFCYTKRAVRLFKKDQVLSVLLLKQGKRFEA
ncbi:hypothetical protein [Tenuibacillus multivorans]|uniref:WYL domain-containing protein n=1 Tax=Tenuibacillus multivorans TaxID=237069 RepID=A0A1G9YPL4_9BACI|nr:hypothetical protein [Tenuibacillus multivorans]GEL78841.1 hypothetical protein TMU01_30760 [Tenuibacillus multivorans]SDN10962.1 hypothetical protein SAMN05216498_1501 [Tenuibacillus multivorans]